MKKKTGFAVGIVFLAAVLFLVSWSAVTHKKKQEISITGLKVCHVENPLGIDQEKPLFSWRMEGKARGISQSAYRLLVADSPKALADGVYLWDSGRQEGAQSAGVLYAGDSLLPRHRYFWKVEVWDQNGISHISEQDAWFEMGLMKEGMGEAEWISAPRQKKEDDEGRVDIRTPSEERRRRSMCLYHPVSSGDFKYGSQFFVWRAGRSIWSYVSL